MRMLTWMMAGFVLTLLSRVAFGIGGGDITFTPKNVAPVVFSHDVHSKYRGMRCMACHFDKFAIGSGGFKINKDLLNKREFCGHCHNSMKAFDMEAEKNCVRCHKK